MKNRDKIEPCREWVRIGNNIEWVTVYDGGQWVSARPISERFNWSRRSSALFSLSDQRGAALMHAEKCPPLGREASKRVCVCERKEKSFSDVGLRKCLFSFRLVLFSAEEQQLLFEIRRGANTCYVFIDPALTSAAQEDDGFSELKEKNAREIIRRTATHRLKCCQSILRHLGRLFSSTRHSCQLSIWSNLTLSHDFIALCLNSQAFSRL